MPIGDPLTPQGTSATLSINQAVLVHGGSLNQGKK